MLDDEQPAPLGQVLAVLHPAGSFRRITNLLYRPSLRQAAIADQMYTLMHDCGVYVVHAALYLLESVLMELYVRVDRK